MNKHEYQFTKTDALALIAYVIIEYNEIYSKQYNYAIKYIKEHGGLDYIEHINDILGGKKEVISLSKARRALVGEEEKVKHDYLAFLWFLAEINDKFVLEKSFLKKLLKPIRSSVNLENYKKYYVELYEKENINNLLKAHISKINYKKILNIGEADYEEVASVYESVNNVMNKFMGLSKSEIRKVKNQRFQEELKKFIWDFIDKFKEYDDLAQKEINAKRAASKKFTISFVGRTKSGKSTLHSIMCEEGEVFIGRGKQRTTRYNRIFDWNNIRIIDTPGIGSPESEGKKDEEIAESILGESDIICFVTKNDAQQQDIIDFMDLIAKRNKPILVVLNYFQSLTTIPQQRKFKKNPNKWFEEEGERSIQGYITRLVRNAEKKEYNGLISVVPVYLLAYSKGKEKNDLDMMNGSHYEDLIREIEQLTIGKSLILKSQTILDDTASVLNDFRNEVLIRKKKEIKIYSRKIGQKKSDTTEFIRQETKKLENEIKKQIDRTFDDFLNQKLPMFVDNNYKETNSKIVQDKFKKQIEDYNLQGKIEKNISGCIKQYKKSMKNYCEQLSSEIMYASLNTKIENNSWIIEDIHGKRSYPIAEGFQALSIVFDGISVLPYPYTKVIGVIGSFVFSLVKGRLKKKKRKNAEVKAEFHKKISDKVKKNCKDTKDNIWKKQLFPKVKKLNDELIQLLVETEKIGKCLGKELEKNEEYLGNEIKKIDELYALRILNFLKINEDRDFTMEDIVSKKIMVYRDRKEKKFEIKVEDVNIKKTFDLTRMINMKDTLEITKFTRR